MPSPPAPQSRRTPDARRARAWRRCAPLSCLRVPRRSPRREQDPAVARARAARTLGCRPCLVERSRAIERPRQRVVGEDVVAFPRGLPRQPHGFPRLQVALCQQARERRRLRRLVLPALDAPDARPRPRRPGRLRRRLRAGAGRRSARPAPASASARAVRDRSPVRDRSLHAQRRLVPGRLARTDAAETRRAPGRRPSTPGRSRPSADGVRPVATRPRQCLPGPGDWSPRWPSASRSRRRPDCPAAHARTRFARTQRPWV